MSFAVAERVAAPVLGHRARQGEGMLLTGSCGLGVDEPARSGSQEMENGASAKRLASVP